MIAIGFIVAGGKAVPLIYGPRYAGAGVFIGWLSAMWAVRIVRVAPVLAAMAYGDTRNSMISNLTRLSALFGILVVVSTGHSMVWIAICGFLGELLALTVCVWQLQIRHCVPGTLCFKPYAAFFAGASISGVVAAAGIIKVALMPTLLIASGLGLVQIFAMIWIFSRLREEMNTLLLKLRSSFTAAKVAT